MIKIGDEVVLTKLVSVKHFQSVGLSPRGVIRDIDQNHYVGTHRRPYGIEFIDRVGVWYYSIDEFRKAT